MRGIAVLLGLIGTLGCYGSGSSENWSCTDDWCHAMCLRTIGSAGACVAGDCECAAYCGNGLVESGERCDDGTGNSDTTPDTCRTDCTLPDCGDAVIDTGEACDDGNAAGGDGCSATCAVERCGNGEIDPGEECDDGLENSDILADACRNGCTFPRCGDRVVDSGEECDLLNLDGQTCASRHDGGEGALRCDATCLFDESPPRTARAYLRSPTA